MQRLNPIFECLPVDFKHALETTNDDMDLSCSCLGLVGSLEEKELLLLLTFKTPELDFLSQTGKRALYVTCV